jgi:hypothetical protein
LGLEINFLLANFCKYGDTYHSNPSIMRIIVRYYSNVCAPTYIVNLEPSADVLSLQEEIFKQVNLNPTMQILHFKRDGYTVFLFTSKIPS